MRIESLTRIAVLVLCATFATFGASGADKPVSNKELGFEVTFPETWTVIEKKIKKIEDIHLGVLALSPTATGATSSANLELCVSDVNEGTTLKAFVENMKVVQPAEKTELQIGGIEAYKLVSKGGAPERPTKYVSYFLVRGARGYFIGFSALKDDYDKYAKDIDTIVKSFKIIETK